MFTFLDYRLEDFILFSKTIYYDLIASYNTQLWPLHILSFLTCFVLLAFRFKNRQNIDATAALLAFFGVTLIVIAKFYFFDHYQTINWAAVYMGYGFIIQGLLLLSYAAYLKLTGHNRQKTAVKTEIRDWFFLISVIFIFPTLALFTHHRLDTLGIVGLNPDSNMMAILAVAALCRLSWVVCVLPILWMVLSGCTHYVLGTDEHWYLCAALIFFSYTRLKMLLGHH